MSTFIVHNRRARDWSGLAFDSSGEKLVCLGASKGVPNIVVQAFDPVVDLFYRTPHPIAASELLVEVEAHIPHSLKDHLGRSLFPSSLGEALLIQCTGAEAPPFSPLAALREVVARVGSVNAAVLQCDNNALLFVRQAGAERTAQFSARTLREFLTADDRARGEAFPDFDAEEIILCGSDLTEDHTTRIRDRALTSVRTFNLADAANLCDFTDGARGQLEKTAHFHTLTLGAAVAYHGILRELSGR